LQNRSLATAVCWLYNSGSQQTWYSNCMPLLIGFRLVETLGMTDLCVIANGEVVNS
jgi:hypothetical protein